MVGVASVGGGVVESQVVGIGYISSRLWKGHSVGYCFQLLRNLSALRCVDSIPVPLRQWMQRI